MQTSTCSLCLLWRCGENILLGQTEKNDSLCSLKGDNMVLVIFLPNCLGGLMAGFVETNKLASSIDWTPRWWEVKTNMLLYIFVHHCRCGEKPEMWEAHDELLEVDLPVAIVVEDVDHPPEIAWNGIQMWLNHHLTRGFCCNSGKDMNS